jgi:hypothetical protein
MAMNTLTLRYEPDPEDDVGKLWLTVQTERFVGSGFFWSYRDGVRGLADKLAAYPLPEPAAEAWGYNKAETNDLILAVQITPVNCKGDLVARVEVADLYDVAQRLSTNFSTDYVSVDAFRQQLNALAEGKADEAMLGGI